MPDAITSATVVAVILLVLVGYVALIRAIMAPSTAPDDLSETIGRHISR